MGILAKTVPQMNVLFVGMPLYIMIGLTTFGLSLSLFVPLIGRAIAESKDSVMRVLMSM
jgi:flagellar biosynthetic protein FliR/FlhB